MDVYWFIKDQEEWEFKEVFRVQIWILYISAVQIITIATWIWKFTDYLCFGFKSIDFYFFLLSMKESPWHEIIRKNIRALFRIVSSWNWFRKNNWPHKNLIGKNGLLTEFQLYFFLNVQLCFVYKYVEFSIPKLIFHDFAL